VYILLVQYERIVVFGAAELIDGVTVVAYFKTLFPNFSAEVKLQIA
jgi:hypothetical protein